MIQVIPAIDLMDGNCVRLTHGDFSSRTVYDADPLVVAMRFQAAGFKRVHMVDLDGARSGRPRNLRVLERIASRTDLVIDFGGGLKTHRDVDDVFAAGAHIANVGSVAAREPEKFREWLDHFGGDRFLLGVDVKERRVMVNGWQTATEVSVKEMLNMWLARGISEVFITDVQSDGAMAGPAVSLYSEVLEAFPDLRLIASGGVSSEDDVLELDHIGCSGAIVGKAIYEGAISLETLGKYAG